MKRRLSVIWILCIIMLFLTFGESKADALRQYEFGFENELYSLPIKYEDFVRCGWKSADVGADDMIPAEGRRVAESFQWKDYYCLVDITNWDISSRPASECYITSINMMSLNAPQCQLPEGIVLRQTTRNELVATLGKPDAESDYSITYGDYDQSWEFVFNNTGIVNSFAVTNQVKPTDFAYRAISSDVPADIAMFIPEVVYLEEDLSLVTCKFEGDVYRLPVSVTAMMDNGWSIINKDAETVGSGDYTYITLTRNGVEERFYVRNYSANASLPEYCFICEFAQNQYDSFSLELSHGICVGASIDTFMPLLPVDTTITQDKDFHFKYSYGGNRYNYSQYIIYSKEGIITNLTIRYEPRYRSYFEDYVIYYDDMTEIK